MTQNRIAIVTAAGKGIGAACARGLAETGHKVVLMSVSGSAIALAEQLGGVGMQGSVLEPGDLEALVALAMERHGRIDVVVSNTGHGAGTTDYNHSSGFHANDPVERLLLEIDDADWHAGLDLYLMVTIRMARLVTPIMVAQGGGVFLNISSFAATEARPASPMSILRGGLHGFTKLYSDHYARAGIRMNNLLPGFMMNVEIGEQAANGIPLGRSATERELSRTVAFLCGPDSGYITGQNILMDGGANRAIPH
jgi:NAD(P)-dependent dehydrogenase (short-subunit alcohol dehydrogenase family)